MEWNVETIAKLRTLWSEGLSTAEIGRRMGVSKNAVVGKAHRLNLESRPSPIRRGEPGAPRPPRPPRRITGPTLPPLATHEAPVVATLPAAPPAMRAQPLERPAPVLRAISTPRTGGRVTSCCWPLGEPGKPSFRFCDADAVCGKPYCDEHAAIAYVKVKDRRDDAA